VEEFMDLKNGRPLKMEVEQEKEGRM